MTSIEERIYRDSSELDFFEQKKTLAAKDSQAQTTMNGHYSSYFPDTPSSASDSKVNPKSILKPKGFIGDPLLQQQETIQQYQSQELFENFMQQYNAEVERIEEEQARLEHLLQQQSIVSQNLIHQRQTTKGQFELSKYPDALFEGPFFNLEEVI